MIALSACSEAPVAPIAVTADLETAALSATKFWEVGSSVAWNKVGRDLVRTASPGVQGRNLVYLSIAQYNAIVAAEDTKERGNHASPAAAAAAASHAILSSLHPAAVNDLNALLAAQRSAEQWSGEKRKNFAMGEAVGRAIAAQVLAYAATDRVNLMAAPPNPGGPGYWTGTNPLRGFIGARTFALTSDDQFRPAQPPAINSPEFQNALAEIRMLTNSNDPAFLASAQLWAGRAAGYMNEIAAGMIVDHRRSEREAARIFAVANMAGFDVLDACFDAKLAYYLIRPSQIDPAVKLLVGLPNHPSYPSAHSCITTAFATVLADAFPTETAQLDAMVVDAGLSRMYAGLHYRFDCTVGQELGRNVAEWVMKVARPNGHHPIPLD